MKYDTADVSTADNKIGLKGVRYMDAPLYLQSWPKQAGTLANFSGFVMFSQISRQKRVRSGPFDPHLVPRAFVILGPWDEVADPQCPPSKC